MMLNQYYVSIMKTFLQKSEDFVAVVCHVGLVRSGLFSDESVEVSKLMPAASTGEGESDLISVLPANLNKRPQRTVR